MVSSLTRRLLLLLSLVLALSGAANGQNAPWEWVQGAGNLNREVAADPAGNIYVVGEYSGPMQLGSTRLVGGGMYVGKLSAGGQWLWATSITSPNHSVQTGDVGTDAAGNVYVGGMVTGPTVVGTTTLTSSGPNGSLFVAKLSPTGQWLWAVQPTGNISAGYVIDNYFTVRPDGRVYMIGTLVGPATFGTTVLTPTSGGGVAGFVAGLDANGQWLWARAVTGGSFAALGAVTTDAAGRVYVAGYVAGGPISAGSFVVQGRPVEDLFLGRLSAAGDWQWVTTAELNQPMGFGIINNQLLTDPTSGAVYVTASYKADARFGPVTLHDGTPPGSISFGSGVVAQCDSLGQWQWATTMGTAASWNVIRGLTWAAGRNLLVSMCYEYDGFQFGPTTLPVPNGGINSALLKVSRGGVPQSSTFVPDVFNQDVVALPGGDVLLVGSVYGSQPMFGTQPFPDPPDPNQYPAYIARMRTAPLALPAEQVETGFQLLPNPATSTVQLALLAGRSTQVELLDFTGRLLRVYPLTQDQTAAALDLRGLPAGLYVVRVGNLTRRLVVE